jgi:hypothetical protein
MLTGRFLSVDPLEWNRYSYALGNPLKYFDPYGLETVQVPCTHGEDGPCFGESIDVHGAPIEIETVEVPLDFLSEGPVLTRGPNGRDQADILAEHARAHRGRCAGYWSLVRRRFQITNDVVPGVTLPRFTPGLIAGRAMAGRTGLMSFGQWVGSGFAPYSVGTEVGVISLGRAGAAVMVGINSALTWLAVSAAFEGGVGVGSLLGAGVDEATGCAEMNQ